MFGLSELEFAEQLKIGLAELGKMRDRFNQFFGIQVNVDIPEDRYAEAIRWLTEMFGPENPDRQFDYAGDARWCRYHPTTSSIAMEEGCFTSSVFGFKTASDAMLFKLSWWN